MKLFLYDPAITNPLDVARRNHMEYFVEEILSHRGPHCGAGHSRSPRPRGHPASWFRKPDTRLHIPVLCWWHNWRAGRVGG
jgi:hypothetical protein